MAPRSKGGTGKSDFRKCLRCLIILHDVDAVKHDVECAAGSAAAAAKEAASDSVSSPSPHRGTTPVRHGGGGGDDGNDDVNDSLTLGKGDVGARRDTSWNSSQRGSSSHLGASYGFLARDGRLHATMKTLKALKSCVDLPPNPKRGDLLLLHPLTMTLARSTIGSKVRVAFSPTTTGSINEASSRCPKKKTAAAAAAAAAAATATTGEKGRPVFAADGDVGDIAEVVCTAWPSEVVPQFSVVATEETRTALDVPKDGDGRLVISNLSSSDLIPASLVVFRLLSTKSAATLESPSFKKYLDRDVVDRCFALGTKYRLKYFGKDLYFRVSHLEPSSSSSTNKGEESFAKLTLNFEKLDVEDNEDEEKSVSGTLPTEKTSLSSSSSKVASSPSSPRRFPIVSSTPKDASLVVEEEDDDDDVVAPRRGDCPSSSLTTTPSFLEEVFERRPLYIVGKDTKIQLSRTSSDSSASGGALDEDGKRKKNVPDSVTYSDLGGMKEKIAEIMEFVEIPLRHPDKMRALGAKLPRGLLLYGPSGVGKTKLVDAIIFETKCYAVKIKASDLWSKFPSESESRLKELCEDASSSAPSLIVVDDLDAICPKKEKGGSENERRLRAAFIAIMDQMEMTKDHGQGHVLFVGVTNALESVDPAFRRPGRFDREIEIPVPTPSERLQILRVLLRDSVHALSESDLKEIADRCHGYVGADFVSLTQKAALATLFVAKQREATTTTTGSEASSSPPPPLTITFDAMKKAMREIVPSAMKEVSIRVPNVKWEDIGGQAELKQKLKQAVEWPLKHPEAFIRMGIVPPRGLLMYGPPGCSKTMIAKAMAKESGLNFLSVKGPELFDKYVGESERAVRELFRRARAAAPAIIFFDEIDALAAERGGVKGGGGKSGGGGVGDRVLAQMLTEMDGVQQLDGVTVIAATNRPDMVDKALLRPGRMDRVIYVPLPDANTRRDIFQLRLSKMPVDLESVVVEDLVSKTEGFSGAEVVAVSHEAAMASLSEGIRADKICHRHFVTALELIKPQVNQELISFYENYQRD